MSERAIDLCRADGSFIAGTLHDELAPEHLEILHLQWHGARGELSEALLRLKVPRERWPQSLHWDWAAKARDLKLLDAAGHAIEGEGKWQGAMLTRLATHVSAHPATLGKPLVYVDYLEVAPWNWTIEDIGQRPKFKAIGSTLLREAILQSRREGFDGRIGLHSLPQSERFYTERFGMEALGNDPTKQNLMYFELTMDGVRRILN